MTSKTQEEAADKRTLAERQRDARATPERACGPDPPDDLMPDLSRTGEPRLDLIPEEAAERMAAVRDGTWGKPKR